MTSLVCLDSYKSLIWSFKRVFHLIFLFFLCVEDRESERSEVQDLENSYAFFTFSEQQLLGSGQNFRTLS